jgi:serine/threonine protein kinase
MSSQTKSGLGRLRPPTARFRNGALAQPDRGLAVADAPAPSALFDASAYLARHPELYADKRAVIDIAYEDYCQHLEAGQPPDLDSFCQRFPGFQNSVRNVIVAQHLLENDPELLADCPPVAWPEPGQSFLGFQLVRELGRGAFAQVFLATEPALGHRRVAIKVSLEGAAEAETLGRLNHPNIVPVHSVRKDPETSLTLVCMPYLGRATLCDVLDRAFARSGVFPERACVILEAVSDNSFLEEPSSESRPEVSGWQKGSYLEGVLHIAAQLADALAFIHAQGICHGDLKPSNVLMTPAGKPMLLDFNLAFERRLYAQQLGGTVPYMSPEQLLATDSNRNTDPALIDSRSDVFALGVILYELLAGVHPFGPVSWKLSLSELRAQLLERQRDGCKSLRAASPLVDKALARLVERCLAYNPKDRPEALELAQSLRRSLSWPRRLRRWFRRHARAVAVTGCLAALLSLPVGYVFSVRDPYSVRQFHQGLEAYRQGDYDQAIQFCSRALEAEPPKVQELFLVRAKANQQRALHFDALLTTAGGEKCGLQELNELERQRLEALTFAFHDYQAAYETEPDARILACIGYCFNLQRFHDVAIQWYKRALDGGLKTAEVYNNLGYSQLKGNHLDEAQASLDEAILLNTSLAAPFHNRAMLDFKRALRNERSTPKAGLSDMERAISLQPKAPELYYDAARLAMLAARADKRQLESALDFLERASTHGQDLRGCAADYLFEPLRGNPRFQSLLHRPKLPRSLGGALGLLDPLPF